MLRDGPNTFDRAVMSATQEQRMLDRFRLRNRFDEPRNRADEPRNRFKPDDRVEEPMEVDRVVAQRDPQRDWRCYQCGELGHFAREVTSKGAEAQERRNGRVPGAQPKPSCRVQINKGTFRALVDTGTDISLLSSKAFRGC